MTQDVIDKLRKKEGSDPFHDAILDHAKRLVKMSRSEMSKFYDDWDLQEKVFRGEMIPDIEDRKQEQKGKPVKMVVPNTFAQVMTFSSFLFLLFNQNRTMFELKPTGDEDFGQKYKDSELILERDWRRNEGNTRLFQHLLDVSRFGTGILECCWSKEKTRAFIVPEPKMVDVGGMMVQAPQAEGSWQEFTKFEGNAVKNVSPYQFFPDTQHSLVNFRRGEFVACEEEYSMADLRALEAAGEVAGVDHIEAVPVNMEDLRGGQTRWSYRGKEKVAHRFEPQNDSAIALVTKMQIKIVPSKFKLDGDKKLGTEEFPVLYHLWYANDNRVIRLEPAYWWHGEFGFTVAQFTPDMHTTLSMGLADLIYRLQDVISWFINSHIRGVRRVQDNRLLVNPAVVDTKSLDGEGDVYLRKGVNAPLDRAVMQMKVQDVTGGHMADAQLLGQIMEMVTGVNNNAMGQYNSGRRAAREVGVVTAGAAGRMKMHGALIWEQSLGKIAKMMRANSRQSLSIETFARLIGGDPALAQQRYLAFQGDPASIVADEDYFVYDATLASDKGIIAQSLQELLVAIVGNPMAGMSLDLSARALVEEIQYLRGGGNVSRFSLQKRIAMGLEPPPMMPVAQPPTQ